jgi:hypothetical protein
MIGTSLKAQFDNSKYSDCKLHLLSPNTLTLSLHRIALLASKPFKDLLETTKTHKQIKWLPENSTFTVTPLCKLFCLMVDM